MRRLLAVLLGVVIGYALWQLYYFFDITPIAWVIVNKRLAVFLTDVLGSPEAARNAMVWGVLALQALPGGVALGAASALILTRLSQARIFFYAILAWPILQFCVGLFTLMMLEKASVVAFGTADFAGPFSSLRSEHLKSIFVMYSVFYICAFLTLTALNWFHQHYQSLQSGTGKSGR